MAKRDQQVSDFLLTITFQMYDHQHEMMYEDDDDDDYGQEAAAAAKGAGPGGNAGANGGGGDDLINYKGIYYNDDAGQKYTDPETGAHFEFRDMCKRLTRILQKREAYDQAQQVTAS